MAPVHRKLMLLCRWEATRDVSPVHHRCGDEFIGHTLRWFRPERPVMQRPDKRWYMSPRVYVRQLQFPGYRSNGQVRYV